MARCGGPGKTALTCTFSSFKAKLIIFNSYGELCQIIGLGGRDITEHRQRCSGKIKSQTNSLLTALKGTKEERTAGDIAYCRKTVTLDELMYRAKPFSLQLKENFSQTSVFMPGL